MRGPVVFQAKKEIQGRGNFEIIVFDMGRHKNSDLIPDTAAHVFQFQLLSDTSRKSYRLDYSYSDYDALFRFNADLMNPNKKQERFAWFCQRLNLSENENGVLSLVLSREPTVPDLTTPVFDESATILHGYKDISQWKQLRGKLLTLESRREAAIAQREADSHNKFMEKLKSLRDEEVVLFTNKDARRKNEREEQRLIRAADAAEAQAKFEARAALEEIREANLNKPKPVKTLVESPVKKAVKAKPKSPPPQRREPVDKTEKREQAIRKIEDSRIQAELKKIAQCKLGKEKKVHAAKIAWEKKMERIHDDDNNRRKLFRQVAEIQREREEEIEQLKTLNPKPEMPQVAKPKKQTLQEKREMNIANKERLRNLREVKIR